MKRNRWVVALVILLMMVLSMMGCTATNEKDVEEEATKNAPVVEVVDAPVEESDYGSEFASDHDPIVTMTLNNDQVLKIQLYPSVAPNTVNNFISLVNEGYYDGLIFHRVIEDFMIQGGCPIGTGTGNPGYSIKGEFQANGFENNISHKPGVLSMARSNDYDSAGSQFFIMHEASDFLDGQYAGFGMVIEGLSHVNAIAVAETDFKDLPIEEVSMKSVTVDLNGYEYSEPEKVE